MAQEFTFTVNGVERTTTQNKPLLRYLRNDLHIHSAKDGCSEGACGTCTIHVDGAAVKACVLTTALAAYKLQRPVKCKLTRAESLAFHPKRHAMDGTFTLGCDAEGNFTGLDCEINFDTGAYALLCGPVLERACTHAVGPYKYQNTDIRGFGYYTNNPPAGAYRGFGVCQSEFALECLIDLLAEKVGLDPWEIRYRNAIEPGEVLPNGQIADCSTALKETLLEVKDAYYAHPGHAGIACAMKNAGVGVGLPDAGRCKIRVEDGRAVVYAATSDIGQGCNAVFLQDVAEACGLPLHCIANGECSTENAPDSGTTSGSRQTVVTGEVVRGAAFLLRDAMLDIEAGKSAPAAPVNAHGDGVKIEYDDGRAYQLHTQELVAGQGMHPQDPAAAIKALEGCEFGYVYLEPTDKLGADVPNPKSHICYGFATHVVILDDDGRVSEVYAAHDSGKVVNLHPGSDRRWRAHGYGLCAYRGLAAQGLRTPGKVRYAWAVPCARDSGYPRHLR